MSMTWLIRKWWVVVLVGLAMPPLGGFAEERRESYYQMLFERKYPSFHFQSVKPAPIDDWMEVVGQGPTGARIVYMSADGRFILAGALFDVEQNVNVTGAALQALSLESTPEVNLTSLALTFHPPKRVKAKARQPVLYFVDPDCPYCQRWDQELPRLLEAGYSIAVLLYPNPRLHPEAVAKSHAVWCAKNPTHAFRAVMAGRMVSRVSGCEAPLTQVREYGQRFPVTGTPFFVLPDGRKFGGYHTADELLAFLEERR